MRLMSEWALRRVCWAAIFQVAQKLQPEWTEWRGKKFVPTQLMSATAPPLSGDSGQVVKLFHLQLQCSTGFLNLVLCLAFHISVSESQFLAKVKNQERQGIHYDRWDYLF